MYETTCGSLADKRAKVVGGGFPISSFIFERGWLKGNLSKDMGAVYTSEYGTSRRRIRASTVQNGFMIKF